MAGGCRSPWRSGRTAVRFRAGLARDVGARPLYLLDTNIEANRTGSRDITDQLYGGDREMRMKQEILLGIGGYRALRHSGSKPTVYHMNEGHSAFLALERIAAAHGDAKRSLSAEAREVASAA